jgi:hypothetical protein
MYRVIGILNKILNKKLRICLLLHTAFQVGHTNDTVDVPLTVGCWIADCCCHHPVLKK